MWQHDIQITVESSFGKGRHVYTVFLLKVRHENNFSFTNLFEVQHSIRVRILIAYTRDDLCRKIETIFSQSFGKGCRIIRRAEILEEIQYAVNEE